jgi:hypothetical protein
MGGAADLGDVLAPPRLFPLQTMVRELTMAVDIFPPPLWRQEWTAVLEALQRWWRLRQLTVVQPEWDGHGLQAPKEMQRLPSRLVERRRALPDCLADTTQTLITRDLRLGRIRHVATRGELPVVHT